MSTTNSGNPRLDARWDAAYTEAKAIVERECGWTAEDCEVVKSTRYGSQEPHVDYCYWCREVQRVADDIYFKCYGERRGHG